MTESCYRVGTTPTPLPGYSPHLKGSLERFWRFLKNDALGTYRLHDAGDGVDGKPVFDGTALDEDTFFTHLSQWIEGYNAEHEHSALGCTPLQAWAADPTPVAEVGFEDLWFGFLLGKDAKVSPKGIRHRSIDYADPEGVIGNNIGRTLEVRYLPHDSSFIEVFKDGAHLATCYPVGSFTPDQEMGFIQARKQARSEAQRAFTRAKNLRAKSSGAIKLERFRGKDGKTRHQIVEPEPSLLDGIDDALAGYVDDTDQDGLF